MKKRMILLPIIVLLLVGLLPEPAACSWISFTNCRIEQLDVNLYRFRTTVDWHVDPMLVGYDYPANWWEHQLDPSIPLDPAPPIYHEGMFNNLRIDVGIAPGAKSYSAFNATINHDPITAFQDPGWSNPGDWYGGGHVPPWAPAGLTGPEFGWDFMYTGDPNSIFTFNWSADFVYGGIYWIPDGTGSWMDVYPHEVETHTGSFQIDLSLVPEPVPLLLVGIGLITVALMKRRGM
jgi:hypothetical protein